MQFPPKKADLIIKEISENFHLFKCFQKKACSTRRTYKNGAGNKSRHHFNFFILLSLTAVSRIPM